MRIKLKDEFMEEKVKLVTDQGGEITEAADFEKKVSPLFLQVKTMQVG